MSPKLKCLICQSCIGQGLCCEKCNRIVVHIRDHPDDKIKNTQMVLDNLSMGEIEYVKNIGDAKCVGCNFIPVNIFFNNRCFSCGIDRRLKEVSDSLDVDLGSAKCSHELSIVKVRYNERKNGVGNAFGDLVNMMPF